METTVELQTRTTTNINQLKNGVYRIYWQSGGYSLAAIGRLTDGTVWMAPSNWINEDKSNIAEHADEIDFIEAIELR